MALSGAGCGWLQFARHDGPRFGAAAGPRHDPSDRQTGYSSIYRDINSYKTIYTHPNGFADAHAALPVYDPER